MKAKIIIENNKQQIILTPENDFEKDIIEKVENNSNKHDIETRFTTSSGMGELRGHRITLIIEDN